MSPENLQEGYRYVLKNFYSLSGMARHFGWSLGMSPVIPKRVLFFLLWNLVNRAFVNHIDRVPVLAPQGVALPVDPLAVPLPYRRSAGQNA